MSFLHRYLGHQFSSWWPIFCAWKHRNTICSGWWMFYTDILYFTEEMRSKGNFYIQTVDQKPTYLSWVRHWSSTDMRFSTSVWSMKAAAWAIHSTFSYGILCWHFVFLLQLSNHYSTVTLFARFLGLSTWLMAVSTIIRRNRVSSEIGFRSLTACTSNRKSENRKVSPKDNSSRQNHLVIVGFLGWPYAVVK